MASALLKPAPIWINQAEIQRLSGVRFTGHAHITGGGLVDNIPRMLPPTCKVVLDRSTWERPFIFSLIEQVGHIEPDEMDRVFNQGLMMTSIIDPQGSEPSTPNMRAVGTVEARDGDGPQVEFTGSF